MTSSTNFTPAPGEIVMDNFLNRNRANQYMAMAFLTDGQTMKRDWITFLESKPTPEVMETCLKKLKADNCQDGGNPTVTFNSMENVVQSVQTGSAQAAISQGSAAAVDQVPISSDSIDYSSSVRTKNFIILKIVCTEADCSDAFKNMEELFKHLASRIHKIQPNRCPQKGCHFSSQTEKQLDDHRKQKHSQVKVWTCKIEKCLKNFANTRRSPDRFPGLVKHFRDRHILGQFKCVKCVHISVCIADADKHYKKCKKPKLNNNNSQTTTNDGPNVLPNSSALQQTLVYQQQVIMTLMNLNGFGQRNVLAQNLPRMPPQTAPSASIPQSGPIQSSAQSGASNGGQTPPNCVPNSDKSANNNKQPSTINTSKPKDTSPASPTVLRSSTIGKN